MAYAERRYQRLEVRQNCLKQHPPHTPSILAPFPSPSFLALPRALSIRLRAYGPNHPDVAQSMNNIGTALSHLGQYAGAEQMFR